MIRPIFLLIFLLHIRVGLAQMITFGEDADEKANAQAGYSGVYNKVYTENTSGTSSSPIKVYIAAQSGENEDDYARVTNPANIPSFDDAPNSVIKISLEYFSNGTDTFYLYAAVKGSDSKWKLLEPSPFAGVTSTSTQSVEYGVNLAELATIAGKELTANNLTFNLDVLFFLSKDILNSPGSEVSPTTYVIYYGFYFSDVVPENAVNLIDLKKGDGRLTAIFDGGEKVTMMGTDLSYKTIAIRFLDTVDHPSGTTFDASGRNIIEEVDPVQKGYITIKGLDNRTEFETSDDKYNIAIALENKYHFISPLSKSIKKSPEKIEVLLEKQACFIMTAGFGEEHYVVDFFRQFRDEYLLTNLPGQKLVQLYYAYSPEYAKKIYQNENARWMVRVAGYSIYYFMNYFWMIFLIFGLSIIGLRKYRLLKISARQC